MLILVSPTKTMHEKGDHKPTGIPYFHNRSKAIVEVLKTLSVPELMELMKINEMIATQNAQRYQAIVFDQQGQCAIDLYDGLQYKYMKVSSYGEEERNFLQKHLRILSGLYGVLQPFDSIYPYRLEMQCKLEVDGYKNLYAFWKNRLSTKLLEDLATHEDQRIVNLASKEYEKAIRKEINPAQWVDVLFQVEKQGKRKSEATAAKMARGMMIRYIAINKLKQVEDIQNFCEDGYQFDQEASDAHTYVFYKVVC